MLLSLHCIAPLRIRNKPVAQTNLLLVGVTRKTRSVLLVLHYSSSIGSVIKLEGYWVTRSIAAEVPTYRRSSLAFQNCRRLEV